MEMIINFLSNPHTTGLHVLIYKIELSKIAEFIDHVNEKYMKTIYPISPGGSINRFIEMEKRESGRGREWISARLSEAIAQIMAVEDRPEIVEYFNISSEDLAQIPSTEDFELRVRRMRRLVQGFFRSKLFPRHLEVLCMNYRISKDEKNMLIELISLKKIGFKIFNDFISCLPVLNDSFEEISQRESHSERYIFKLYDTVVSLWIALENKFLLNDNLENFLTASITYYADEEWRTSVILSSLGVESIFAELYEEEYMKNAPDVPLGGLITQVKKKIKFPSDLMVKIQGLNRARIASVHRSENPVSSKDAVISMMGITSLIIWYFDKY